MGVKLTIYLTPHLQRVCPIFVNLPVIFNRILNTRIGRIIYNRHPIFFGIILGCFAAVRAFNAFFESPENAYSCA